MSCKENFRLEDFFEKGLETHGNSTAVIFDDSQVVKKVSYLEAKQHSDKISEALRNASCNKEIVGVVLNPSVFSPITLLGVLKVPAVFINLDVNIPSEQLHCLISKLNLRTFIIRAENITSFREKCKKFGENIELKPLGDLRILQLTSVHPAEISDDIAYVITTSGTTGNPKIVRVPHKCIVPNIRDISEIFQLTSNDVVFHATPPTFDPSIVEIFMTFASGGTLLVVPPILKMMPKILADILTKRHKVSVIQATPTLISSFGKETLQASILSKSSCLKVLALGGEAFPAIKVLKTWMQEGNQTRFFNLYGITEVSCWSTIQEITKNDIRNEREVYLGKPLSDTIIFVDTEKNKRSDSDCQEVGELFVGGEKRRCIIDSEHPMPLVSSTNSLRSTGDFVRVTKDQLEYIGRKDEQITRNGCRINLSEIEKVTQRYDGIESVCSVPTKDNKIYLFVTINKHSHGECTQRQNELKKQIIVHLKSCLPVYSQPDDIFFLACSMPMTNHGKIDKKKLLEMRSKISVTFDISEEDIGDRVVDIVSESLRYLQKSQIKLNSSFLENGGNSLSSVTLYEKLAEMFSIKLPLLLEKIMYCSLKDVINYLKEGIRHGQTVVENINKFPEKRQICQNHIPKKSKRQKMPAEALTHFEDMTVIKTYSKCDQCSLNSYQLCIQRTSKLKRYYDCEGCNKNMSVNEVRCMSFYTNCDEREAVYQIVECWKWSLCKCVDASPLLIVQREGKRTVFIGSHSFTFAAIDFDSGFPLWTQTLVNRIESSACLLLDGRTVCVGCYSGNMYFLSITNGSVLWKFEAEGEVKSSPVVNSLNGFVYFGSHDKHVYALDPKKKICVWKKCLDMSSIFSSPCLSANNTSLYVATLGGKLFALDSTTGEILWNFDLGKPVFSSPCVNSDDDVLVGCVSGYLHAVSKNGTQKWKFQTGGPIFSSPSAISFTIPNSTELTDSLILFGSHDCSLYCVSALGTTRWCFKTDSEVYSSPFVFNVMMQQQNRTAFSTEDDSKKEKQELCRRKETPLVAACSTKGHLYILKLSDGKLVAKYKFPSDIFSSPVVFEDKIILGCRNDYVYCVKLDLN